jgi:hypothetical protein
MKNKRVSKRIQSKQQSRRKKLLDDCENVSKPDYLDGSFIIEEALPKEPKLPADNSSRLSMAQKIDEFPIHLSK